MSTYVVRPTSVLTNDGGTNPSVEATVLTNLGDNSDSTTVNNTGTKSISWVFGLGTPTIPSTEFVARVGYSLRWKGNTSGNYSIGGIAYRAIDSKPTGIPSLTPNNSSAFTTTQVAYQSVNWSLSDVSSMRFLWYDGRSSSSWAQTDHADIWASIYTLALANATPSARTETTSVYPTIPVSVTATIDWESGTYDWQNLRKITTEVRIESGGSGVGTGTLVSQGTYTTNFVSTGTQSQNITMPDALANGTYKIYARALRYREDGLVYSDGYSAWSTAATLTMSTPLPNTPTVTLAADNTLDRIAVTVTPVATTGYSGPYIYVQRSDDGGITWNAVRNASGIAGIFGTASTFYDYEAPRATAVYYRAQIQATYSGFVNASVWSSPQSTSVTADSWNLKNPSNPSANLVNVYIVGKPSEQVTEDLGVFRPLGRKYPVVVGGTISGWDGDLDIRTVDSSDWAAVKALAESQAVLYLESPFGWSKYIRLLSGTQAEISGTSTQPRRSVKMSYVQVDQPAIVTGQSSATVTIPSTIDGGAATVTFTDMWDGGTSISTSTATIDGGASV